MRVLAADVGGTKVNLAIYDWTDGRLMCRHRQTFASQKYDSIEPILAELTARLGGVGHLDAAAFGVAGPVAAGRARVVNLGWSIDAGALATALNTSAVMVINDLEAAAFGVLTLGAADLQVLNAGVRRAATAAVIAAGTGLGEGLLWWDGERHRPAPSEGGHAEFAPRSDIEMDLLVFLRRRFAHVSYERVLSGAGLVNIYEFLRESGRATEPADLAQRMQSEDAAAIISRAALSEHIPICVQALEMFVSIYGAEAGNLALKVLPAGGLYVAGGIAPKIATKMGDGTFLAAFLDKGRMRPLLETIPVDLVCAEDTPLRGAAYCALRSLGI